MPLIRLDHVNIRTANLKEMTAWYVDVLGMQLGERPGFPFPGAWLCISGTPVVHLIGVGTAPEGKDPKIEHFAFAARGKTGFLAKLDSTGTPYRLGKVPGDGIVQVNVHDPDGNHIHVDFYGETNN
ncbi:VOC family protein [Roseibium sp. RKSG952]|uniref:VOC family protein n=1 Tax=Roseibium sp. RKSG952 TaxID=2529384 RepID=UPI0012BC735E|nr:VOC family protein [Roseibium sp. RKSG952]MTH95245.1 glyoxalase [Roseibium sp. RKSG952]